jgi:hypothetical protein
VVWAAAGLEEARREGSAVGDPPARPSTGTQGIGRETPERVASQVILQVEVPDRVDVDQQT